MERAGLAATDYQPIPLPDYTELPVEEMRRHGFYGIRTRHTCASSRRVRAARHHRACLLAAGTRRAGPTSALAFLRHHRSSAQAARARRRGSRGEGVLRGRAGQEWLEALKPLGTDADKSFLEIAPYLICIFGARRSPGAMAACARTTTCRSRSASPPVPDRGAAQLLGWQRLRTRRRRWGSERHLRPPGNDKPYILLVTGYPAPTPPFRSTPHRRNRSAKSRHFCREFAPRRSSGCYPSVRFSSNAPQPSFSTVPMSCRPCITPRNVANSYPVG